MKFLVFLFLNFYFFGLLLKNYVWVWSAYLINKFKSHELCFFIFNMLHRISSNFTRLHWTSSDFKEFLGLSDFIGFLTSDTRLYTGIQQLSPFTCADCRIYLDKIYQKVEQSSFRYFIATNLLYENWYEHANTNMYHAWDISKVI